DVTMSTKDLRCPFVCLLQQARHLLIDDGLRGLGVLAGADFLGSEVHRPASTEPDRPEPCAHPEFTHHPNGELRRPRQVLGRKAFEASLRPSRRRSLASAKSWAVIWSRRARTATMAASFTRLARSAPEKPGVPRATASSSTSGPSFFPLAWMARMAARSRRFGRGISAWRSNLPGRRSAGSRISGRLVAATTT